MGLFPGDNLHRTCAAVLIALVSLMFSSCEFFRTLFLGPLYGITLEVETGGNCSVEPAAEKEENGVFYFRDGTTVTMTAAPSAGYRFTGWVVDAQRSYSKILTIPALGRDTGVTLEFSPVETAWTILVYLDGDNDLEGNAITDFEEMETGLYLAQTGDPGVMDKVAVAVQFDRGNEISSSFDGVWTTARRYEVLPDYSAGCGSRLVEDLGEVNMGDPATLKDFLEWGKCTFPAEYYVLVLWNHGGGARDLTPDDGRRDICFDETPGSDVLYVGEITDGLSGEHAVDILGMDACLMGTLETAYEYRPGTGGFGADYMVASPAEERGDGWEYDRIFSRLAGEGNYDAEEDPCYDAAALTPGIFAALLVKEYRDTCIGYSDQTMTAFRLAGVPGVKTAVDELAGELAYQKSEVLSRVDSGGIPFYTSPSDSRSVPYFELGNLCDILSSPEISADITSAAGAVKTALRDLIVSAWGGADYGGYEDPGGDGYRGVSIFFSEGPSDYSYQWWYTSEDTTGLPGADETWLYGKLDFCGSDGTPPVDSWKELFDTWY